MRSTASPSAVASPRRAEDLASEHFAMKEPALDKRSHQMSSPQSRSPGLVNPNNPPIEAVQTSNVLDVASLVLYGTHAIPVRLKILLDRVLAALPHEDVKQVLAAFGWSYDDYLRGYIVQDPTGSVLDKWALVTREEELVVLQQFLRFAETRALAQQFMLADNAIQAASDQSDDLNKLIEKSARAASILCSKANDLICKSSSADKPKESSSSSCSTPKQASCAKEERTLPLPSASQSPPGASTPSQSSPLNKLQSMQPYDYRQEQRREERREERTTPLSSPPLQLGMLSHQLSLNHSSDLSLTDGGSDDDTNDGAINLTATSADALLAAEKAKHLRKSTTPMKRRWDPMVLSALTTNPSTGKRRVQCHVCLKTFCDKGALKIHFSAVHLREMHKCTVDGCNMMFSSRRSRNRHSANPNPKLHTPNLRRKISPHDGRTANPFPVLPPSALLALNGTSPSHLSSVLQEGFLNSKLAGLANEYTQSLLEEPMGGVPLSLINKNHSASRPQSHQAHHEAENSFEGMNLCMKPSSAGKDNNNSELKASADCQPLSLTMGSEKPRKRKALNPTRVAAVAPSDDELRYPSSEDESTSDTFENGVQLKSDEDDLTSSDASKDAYDDLSPLPKHLKTEREPKDIKNPWKFEVDTSALRDKAKEADGDKNLDRDTDSPEHRIKQEQTELGENPLRHLESLSMGAFTAGLLQQSAVRAGGVSFHAPGLGLADGPALPREDDGRESPASSADQSLLPVYRDAALVGSLEIPVDREDPRRCTACGRVFQNHFGVKTHYQNVHLKLMHKCTVEGCNAAFPSRRSRDRHSANLNLHRKLLSTSSLGPAPERGLTGAPGAAFGLDKMFPYGPPDFFSRLYDPQNLAEMYQRLPTAAAEAGLLFPPGFGAFPHLLSQMPVLNTDRGSPAASGGGSLHSRSPSPHDEDAPKSSPSSPQTSSPTPAHSQNIEPMPLTT